MSRALIIVDMLNDFVLPEGTLRVPGVEGIVANAARELARARQEGDLVIFVCDSHDPDDREFLRYPPHAVTGTPGAEVIAELAPRAGEVVLTKQRFNPFYETDLDALLKEHQVHHATVVGVCTHICIMETVAGLCDRDIDSRVPSDAVADIDDEMEAAAFKRMASIFAAEII